MEFDAKYAWVDRIMNFMRRMIQIIKDYYGIED